ncbi:unnamed protein product [Soboliphyme baturini]|uniref:Dpy-30 domain-containing protein n=1 Tax=Soboliphyme baturini TaxID=241478 RepID=A0A183JA29_9BILA|nr:unnamed protein product [Soboliphyme baturini]
MSEPAAAPEDKVSDEGAAVGGEGAAAQADKMDAQASKAVSDNTASESMDVDQGSRAKNETVAAPPPQASENTTPTTQKTQSATGDAEKPKEERVPNSTGKTTDIPASGTATTANAGANENQPPGSTISTRQYLDHTVVPILLQALATVAKERWAPCFSILFSSCFKVRFIFILLPDE